MAQFKEFGPYVHKVLRTVTDRSISKDSMKLIIKVVKHIYVLLMDNAATLSRTSRSPNTITWRDIEVSVRLILPKKLAEAAWSDANRTLTKFRQNSEHKQGDYAGDSDCGDAADNVKVPETIESIPVARINEYEKLQSEATEAKRHSVRMSQSMHESSSAMSGLGGHSAAAAADDCASGHSYPNLSDNTDLNPSDQSESSGTLALVVKERG